MPYERERCSLQGALKQGARIVWTIHANERSKERQINKLVAERVIRRGVVDDVALHPKGETWRVVGQDNDGRRIGVVVSLKDNVCTISVVTVINDP
ncbi:MAG: DUF4258 domain-containing protein [Acetobacter okinawensis]|uniref:DUF4258 domain-containing protein n=1 Tax=Acetobacter okinawensis TaxID=1076594 RepID=UPI0039E73629